MTEQAIPAGRTDLFDAAQIARFWSTVSNKSIDECWPWTGAIYTDRGRTRGRFYANSRVYTASQAATIIAHGPKPENYEHLHSCGNPLCCNPKHLRWGTHAENMTEMKERGRGTLKSYCKRGHALNGDNVRILRRGNRECRTCQTIRKAVHTERNSQ